MQVIFTHSVVGRLLLGVRRVGMALEGTWAAMCVSARAEHSDLSARPHAAHPLWQLRAHLSHFVGCLLQYLQVAAVSQKASQPLTFVHTLSICRAIKNDVES